MSQEMTGQMVRGDWTSLYLQRRKIDMAIKHLDSAMKRLIDLEEDALQYDPEYVLMVAGVISNLFPLRDNLSTLRQSTYVWASKRAKGHKEDALLAKAKVNERLRAYVQMGVPVPDALVRGGR